MHVAIFGAGALGAVYGVRLALYGGVDVSFIVRPARLSEPEVRPHVIERVLGNRRDAIPSPQLYDAVPDHADAILLAVATDDLEAIAPALGSSRAPIVVLTPMLPKDWSRMRAAFGDRVHAAMPNLASYRRSDGVVRYWLGPTPTEIDEPRPTSPYRDIVVELARALGRAGLRGRLSLGVHEKNPASTVCFIPIAMAFALAGSAEALASDARLLSLAERACREGVRLSHRLGEPVVFARLAPTFAAPWSLHAWPKALGRVSPEALFYIEEHFGRKLRSQHRLMIGEMIELAKDKGLPHEAFDEIARRFAES